MQYRHGEIWFRLRQMDLYFQLRQRNKPSDSQPDEPKEMKYFYQFSTEVFEKFFGAY